MKKQTAKLNKTALNIIICITLLVKSSSNVFAATYQCGDDYYRIPGDICNCENDEPQNSTGDPDLRCCGWLGSSGCLNYNPSQPAPPPATTTSSPLNPIDNPVTDETLDILNPLLIEESEFAEELSTPEGILNRALEFIFPIAGLILFVMIVWGGFEMLTGAASKKGLDAGKQRVTAAIIGFLLLFASYWIVQIVERVLGVDILGN